MAVKSGSRLCSYPVRQNRSISLHFRNKRVFAFNAKIQDGHQKWQENDFCEKLPVDCRYPAGQKLRRKLLLSRSISEKNTLLCFTQKFKMAAKSGREKYF